MFRSDREQNLCSDKLKFTCITSHTKY